MRLRHVITYSCEFSMFRFDDYVEGSTEHRQFARALSNKSGNFQFLTEHNMDGSRSTSNKGKSVFFLQRREFCIHFENVQSF